MTLSPEFIPIENQDTGRVFYIEIKFRVGGFRFRNKQVDCRDCPNSAVWQIAKFDHLFQPQGSEYFCDQHILRNIKDNYLHE